MPAKNTKKVFVTSALISAALVGAIVVDSVKNEKQKAEKTKTFITVCLPRQECQKVDEVTFDDMKAQAKAIIEAPSAQFSDDTPEVSTIQDAYAVMDAVIKRNGGMTFEDTLPDLSKDTQLLQ